MQVRSQTKIGVGPTGTHERDSLKARIEALTKLAGFNLEYQGLSWVFGIADGGGKFGGQGSLPTTNLEAMQVNYNMVIRRNWGLDDDYQLPSTQRVRGRWWTSLRNTKIGANNGLTLIFSPSWLPLEGTWPRNISINDQNCPSTDWNANPIFNSSGRPKYPLALW